MKHLDNNASNPKYRSSKCLFSSILSSLSEITKLIYTEILLYEQSIFYECYKFAHDVG